MSWWDDKKENIYKDGLNKQMNTVQGGLYVMIKNGYVKEFQKVVYNISRIKKYQILTSGGLVISALCCISLFFSPVNLSIKFLKFPV